MTKKNHYHHMIFLGYRDTKYYRYLYLSIDIYIYIWLYKTTYLISTTIPITPIFSFNAKQRGITGCAAARGSRGGGGAPAAACFVRILGSLSQRVGWWTLWVAEQLTSNQFNLTIFEWKKTATFGRYGSGPKKMEWREVKNGIETVCGGKLKETHGACLPKRLFFLGGLNAQRYFQHLRWTCWLWKSIGWRRDSTCSQDQEDHWWRYRKLRVGSTHLFKPALVKGKTSLIAWGHSISW